MLLVTFWAHAGPWVEPGDPALRHDIQLLADARVITGPVLSWPLSWGELLPDLSRAPVDTQLRPDVRQALERVRRRAQWETAVREVRAHTQLSLAEQPRLLRTFEDTPREDVEAQAGAEWTGERWSARLQASLVDDPADGKEFRADGSYIGVALGNWMLSAGYQDRWWGPGHEGSLILSSNARPIPTFAVERNQSTPFETKWLSWLGPWKLAVLWGQLESDNAVPDTRFFGARFELRPLPDLQIGLSRTAQWCGEGRPCGFDAFTDMLLGRSNLDEGVRVDVANQLGGYDLRWASPVGDAPYAFYAQAIGEDEAGGLPSRLFGLVGAELWGSWGERSWRAHLEYADTACSFLQSEPRFNCAYNNAFYPDGYRYRGRSIGHSLDNDSQVISLGGTLVEPDGNSWQAMLRSGDLNRGGAADDRNTVTPTAQRLLKLEVSHRRLSGFGIFDAGVEFGRIEDELSGSTSEDFGAFLRWRRDFE